MLSALTNCLKLAEVRQRLFFTLLVVVIVRIGAAVPCPGVNVVVLEEYFKTVIDKQSNSVVGMFNIFTGGALENCAIFSLGIIPYISASIAMQMLTAIVPTLSKLSREDGGRQKITQYTRYVTIGICLFQGILLARQVEAPKGGNLFGDIAPVVEKYGDLVPNPGFSFEFTAVLSMTAGTLLLMWLGEQISERGVGNGVSLIITINIVSRMPSGFAQGWELISGTADKPGTPVLIVPILLFLFLIIAGTIAITLGVRRVIVRYAQRARGSQATSSSSFIPLKVNYASTMPIIFAQSMITIPQIILATLPVGTSIVIRNILEATRSGPGFYIIFVGMIFFFSFFWVATTFNPLEIAENLKNNNGFVPNVRPGPPTAEFLEELMNKLTLAGCIFLTILAVLPHLITDFFQVPYNTAAFFGGTSLLITIGVILDTVKQMETHQLNRNYDTYLDRARRWSKRDVAPVAETPMVSTSIPDGLLYIFILVGLFLLIGAVMLIVGL